MTWLNLLAPGVLVVVLVALLGAVRLPLNPRVVLVLLAGLSAVAGATTLLMAASVAITFLVVHTPLLAPLFAWCPIVSNQHHPGAIPGILATAGSAFMLLRARRVLRQRRVAATGFDGQRFKVLPTGEPFAFAVPGRPGCVVVSHGMLAALEPRERQAVFAHERAHLHQGHHRFLLVSALSAAVCPPLRWLASQVKLATERCADEAAAEALDGDRVVVASAIARAALVTSPEQGDLSFGGGPVAIRVAELLAGQRPRQPRPGPALGAGMAVVAAVAGGSVQAHHLAAFALHLCGS